MNSDPKRQQHKASKSNMEVRSYKIMVTVSSCADPVVIQRHNFFISTERITSYGLS